MADADNNIYVQSQPTFNYTTIVYLGWNWDLTNYEDLLLKLMERRGKGGVNESQVNAHEELTQLTLKCERKVHYKIFYLLWKIK